MTTHELKIWPQYFDAVANGTKTFEIRFEGDRDYAVGDTLILKEWRESRLGKKDGKMWQYDAEYTGREVVVHVTYILRGFGLQPGYVCLAITKVD
jgi:ASC-1-like (ASCH) protein